MYCGVCMVVEKLMADNMHCASEDSGWSEISLYMWETGFDLRKINGCD